MLRVDIETYSTDNSKDACSDNTGYYTLFGRLKVKWNAKGFECPRPRKYIMFIRKFNALVTFAKTKIKTNTATCTQSYPSFERASNTNFATWHYGESLILFQVNMRQNLCSEIKATSYVRDYFIYDLLDI